MAKATREEAAISIKRWIMTGMLEKPDSLAMKKAGENFYPASPGSLRDSVGIGSSQITPFSEQGSGKAPSTRPRTA